MPFECPNALARVNIPQMNLFVESTTEQQSLFNRVERQRSHPIAMGRDRSNLPSGCDTPEANLAIGASAG